MSNFFATNHVTVEASDITTGQSVVGTSAQQLTSETGPLKHGIFLTPRHSADFFINTFGGSPEVTKTNGMLFGTGIPLFIPIKDPSVIRIVADASTKTMTYIMY